VRIARHYAEVRGVPVENIIAQPMPRGETISWTEFVATIWQPPAGRTRPARMDRRDHQWR